VALTTSAQADYAAGYFRSVARHLIPGNGAWAIINGLLDDDGLIYKRGGSSYLSTSGFGSALTFLWSGYLGPGERTVIANTDDFGVLDAAEAPINLGLAGLDRPARAVEVGGVLFIGGGTLYGGSRKTAVYSTGTASVTQGSKVVTGAGTTWNTLVDAGMLFKLAGRVYPVASIDSTTQLTLRDPIEEATAAGLAYTLNHIYTATTPYRTSDIYAVAANRLFSLEGRFAYFTGRDTPHAFAATDFHELTDGSEIIGGIGLGDSLLIFASSGLWLLENLAFDIVDQNGNAQHRLRRVSEELVLVSHEGLASWGGQVIAPCADGIWLVDGLSAPDLISRSINDQWKGYVQAGYRAGTPAVIGAHLLLPVLDAAGGPQDVLVCRLDRILQTRLGPVRPWTSLAGFSADVPAFAVRIGGAAAARDPQLLAASGAGRVLNATSFFDHDGSAAEPDGSQHDLDIVTRDFAAKDGIGYGTVRRGKLHYTLLGTDTAITGYYATNAQALPTTEWGVSEWGEFEWESTAADQWAALTDPGPAQPNDGTSPHYWQINKRCQYIRFRFKSSGPSATLQLRTYELRSRHSEKP
jgi:hypothetical protein